MRCIPRIADRFQKGDLIATQVNIFGDTIKEYLAPEDGIAIGHCTNPIGQTGARILHLGVLMDDADHSKFERISGCSLESTVCKVQTADEQS